jgi:thymidylate kinase
VGLRFELKNIKKHLFMKNMKQKSWSRFEEIELDDLYRKQLNYKDLAKKFSCTVVEIKRKLKETEDVEDKD